MNNIKKNQIAGVIFQVAETDLKSEAQQIAEVQLDNNIDHNGEEYSLFLR